MLNHISDEPIRYTGYLASVQSFRLDRKGAISYLTLIDSDGKEIAKDIPVILESSSVGGNKISGIDLRIDVSTFSVRINNGSE